MTHQAFCIEVGIRPDRSDVRAARLLAQADEAGLTLGGDLSTATGYSLRLAGGEDDARRLAREVLADPVMNTVRIFRPEDDPRPSEGRRIEVVRRPGVMDPVSQSVVRAAASLGLTITDVRSWDAYLVPASTADDVVDELGRTLLANTAIEEVRVDPEQGIAPVAELPDAPFVLRHVPLREAPAEELRRLSEQGCLALDGEEMATIQGHFVALGRDPTDIELETIAQTWSEHCKHKTLTGLVEYEGETLDNLLKSTIARATHELDREFCRSVFVDNAGVVAFDDEHHLTYKVETHNHPSAIEPYGGAGTGMGGVLRDTMGTGLGARPIVSTDVFCFGPPDLPLDAVPKGCLHPRRIMRGVVSGVRDYGNRMGIPTAAGALCFDERYVGNPLVYCGSVGLLPVDRLEKVTLPGDLILLAGGRTGRDGIHGATFSSLELHDESETVSSGAVQIGNAIEEKKVLDAMLTARDQGLYRCVTDCGAGGLSSAVGEMGETTGAHVVLDTVPLKYHGLTHDEIWISEAQERMVYAVPPEHREAILAVFAAEDVEATIIGEFNDSGQLTAEFHGEPVMDLSMQFLHDGLPRQTRKAVRRRRDLHDPTPLAADDVAAMLPALLAHPNVASKAWVIRQYDHEVQAGSVVKPLVGPGHDGPGDGAVIAPVLGSRRGFALGCGINPNLGDVDPYQMALHAIDEAMRNVVVLGADPDQVSILDNFSWGNCEKPENLGDLVEACRACYDGAMAFRTPFISGKDSLNNDYRVGNESRSIPPTLLISALGIVPDVGNAMTMDLKAPGHALLLVGATGPHLGGSLLAQHGGALGRTVPPVDLTAAPAVLVAIHALINAGLLHACHDLSEGGLAVAAAECAFAGDVGAEIDAAALTLDGDDLSLGARLFGETPTRFLMEVDEADLPAVTAALGAIPWSRVGTTTPDSVFVIRDGDTEVARWPLTVLKAAFTATLDLDHELEANNGAGDAA